MSQSCQVRRYLGVVVLTTLSAGSVNALVSGGVAAATQISSTAMKGATAVIDGSLDFDSISYSRTLGDSTSLTVKGWLVWHKPQAVMISRPYWDTSSSGTLGTMSMRVGLLDVNGQIMTTVAHASLTISDNGETITMIPDGSRVSFELRTPAISPNVLRATKSVKLIGLTLK